MSRRNPDDRVDMYGEGQQVGKRNQLIPGFWFGDEVAGGAFHHKEERGGGAIGSFCLNNNNKRDQCLPDYNLG